MKNGSQPLAPTIESGRRPRVLLIADAVTLAHVSRLRVLADSLARLPVDVFFACDPRMHWVLKGGAFSVLSIPSITPDQFLGNLAHGRPLYSAETLEFYVREDLRLLNEVRPDLVVGDLRLSLAVSARLAKVPYASVCNVHWSPYARVQFPAPDIRLFQVLGERLGDQVFHRIRPLAFGLHARPLNIVRRRFGMARGPYDIRDAYTTADMTLYADAPGLVPTDPLPAHHHYLGPVVWEPAVPLPEWWDRVPTDRPCIYVTLGSSGRLFLQPMVIEALGGLPVTAMVATAARFHIDAPPSNVFIADFLPGSRCMARAAAAVTNGGCGGTAQALQAGIPIIGLTSLMDQDVPMQAVESAGAGIRVRSCSATVEKLRRAIMTAIGTASIRERARSLGEQAASYDPSERFRAFVANQLGVKDGAAAPSRRGGL